MEFELPEGLRFKMDILRADEVTGYQEISESVSIETGDGEHPVCVEADGWMSLPDAKKLLEELQKAIELCEPKAK